MASMQLFVSLAVALSLEGILAYEEPKCVHQEKPTLCILLLPLYKDTAELEVTLVKAALPDLSAAVSDAMQAVLEALSMKEKTKVLSALKKSLIVETIVRIQLKKRCRAKKIEDDVCKKSRRSSYNVIVGLVKTIMEAADGYQKARITQIYETYAKGQNKIARLPKLSRKILGAI